jgi:hypothetical protein
MLTGFSGCSLVGISEGPMTIEHKSALVKSAARTGTYLALTEVYENDRAKMLQKASLIKDHISKFSIASPVTMDKIYDTLLAHVPAQYALLMQNAIDIFTAYFTVDLEGNPLLTEDNIALIYAFCEGVVEGCELVTRS